MELRDLIVTPFYLLFVYFGAYLVRPYVCDSVNYRFFFPALTVRIIGALAVGLIYQFYYNGGDTFNFHTYGSRVIWDATLEDPLRGLSLIFLPFSWHSPEVQHFASTHVLFYGDSAAFFVIRVASLFDLFTFSAYSATAVLFAVTSFAGGWMLFTTFCRAYPHLVNWLALAILFVPSVFFWGSGLLKDTLVLAALGASVFFAHRMFISPRGRITIPMMLLIICLIVIFVVKKYVLLCFVPAAMIWIYMHHLMAIRSVALRIVMVPLLLSLLLLSSYYSVNKIGEGDYRYSLDRLAITAQITAYDIGFYSGRDAGSGYSIGTLDGTFMGMLQLAPQAVNVSLFRPYIWEAKNPLMFVAAIESMMIMGLTLLILVRSPGRFFRSFRDPYIMFCVIFAVTFAFAVGVSTYNFGTLVRYKIPMLPFYAAALVLIINYVNRDRKAPALASTE